MISRRGRVPSSVFFGVRRCTTEMTSPPGPFQPTMPPSEKWSRTPRSLPPYNPQSPLLFFTRFPRILSIPSAPQVRSALDAPRTAKGLPIGCDIEAGKIPTLSDLGIVVRPSPHPLQKNCKSSHTHESRCHGRSRAYRIHRVRCSPSAAPSLEARERRCGRWRPSSRSG